MVTRIVAVVRSAKTFMGDKDARRLATEKPVFRLVIVGLALCGLVWAFRPMPVRAVGLVNCWIDADWTIYAHGGVRLGTASDEKETMALSLVSCAQQGQSWVIWA